MLHFPENLRLIRALAGMTQTEFAERIGYGVNKDMLYSYESGKAKPKELIIDRIAQLAGTTPGYLKNKKFVASDFDLNDLKERMKDPPKEPDIQTKAIPGNSSPAHTEKYITLLERQNETSLSELKEILLRNEELLNLLVERLTPDVKQGKIITTVYKKDDKKDK